jgi:hypothetical protein
LSQQKTGFVSCACWSYCLAFLGLGVAAGAERDEVVCRVGAAAAGRGDVVDTEPVGGSAGDASAAVAESDCSPNLLPCRAVELWPA